jgi:2-isopropylmalate synthase
VVHRWALRELTLLVQIEYFCRHIRNREHCVISLHTHNDRGTGVAATELGLMAGGDRVEGCLFGNGERTGNVDIVTVALNMYTQGVAPQLDFSDIYPIIETVTSCNEIPVHPRHPYAGDLVFTAFSGSHQDAIKKGFAAYAKTGPNSHWNLPYLPLDPADIGCTYEAVIRVNSQSGKGGVAYLVQQALQLDLPRRLQVAFYQIVQEVADRGGKEMTADDIERTFRVTYSFGSGYESRFQLLDYGLDTMGDASLADGKRARKFKGKILDNGQAKEITGEGNGPISSILAALAKDCGIQLKVREYSEHAIGTGSDVRAASYVELIPEDAPDSTKTPGFWGVATDEDVTAASLKAVISAVNNSLRSPQEMERKIDAAIAGGGKPNVQIEK